MLDINQTDVEFNGKNHAVLRYKISNVTLKDAGKYTCGAETHEGGDSQVIRLNVERRGKTCDISCILIGVGRGD